MFLMLKITTGTSISSTRNSKSLASVTPDKVNSRKIMVTMIGSLWQKYAIYPIEVTEPHKTKPDY